MSAAAAGGTPAERYDRLYPMKEMDPLAVATAREWLLPGLVMRGKINGWFGFEKAGKSRLLGWVLRHMYSAAPCFDEPTLNPGRTLYLAGEEMPMDVTARLRLYSRIMGVPFLERDGGVDWPGMVTFCEATGMRMEQKPQREWLRDRMHRDGYRTLVIDPLRRIHGAAESSNDEMAPLLNDIREWTNKLGITVIMLHHTGKLGMDDDEQRIATWSRGATDLPAVLDWAVYLRRKVSGVRGRPDGVTVSRAGRATPLPPLKLLDHADREPGWTAAAAAEG